MKFSIDIDMLPYCQKEDIAKTVPFEDVMSELVKEDESTGISKAIIDNPAVTEPILQMIVDKYSDSTEMLVKVINCPCVTTSIFQLILKIDMEKSDLFKIEQSMINSKFVTEDIIKAIYEKHKDDFVFYVPISRCIKTPDYILDEISKDDEKWQAFENIAKNPNTKTDTLDNLLKNVNGDEELAIAIAENENVTIRMLNELYKMNISSKVSMAVAKCIEKVFI